MRSHTEILKREGVQAVYRRLAERGLKLAPITVQKWSDRDAIPGPYWLHLDDIGVATLAELALAAVARPFVPVSPLHTILTTPSFATPDTSHGYGALQTRTAAPVSGRLTSEFAAPTVEVAQ